MKWYEYLETNPKEEDRVWVCDYRIEKVTEKPIRHLKPTFVELADIKESKRMAYFSDYYFREVDEKGKVINNSRIVPFDDAGYRAYPGTPLNVFFTERECRIFYHNTLKKLIEGLEEERVRVLRRYDDIKRLLYEEGQKEFYEAMYRLQE